MGCGKSSLMISIVLVFTQLLSETKGHFLSIEDLEEFYDLEQKLVKTFTTYIEEQKQLLEVVQQRYEEQKRWQPVLNDTNDYLSNPLNVHAILKRLVTDWPLTLALIGGSFADKEDDELTTLPHIEEYHAAIHSIARLQQVYNYTVKELVSGTVFPGTDNTSVLTADDCLSVGRDLYENRHFRLAVDWFQEALALAISQMEGGQFMATNPTSGQTATDPSLEKLYEYLALATCFIGDERQSKRYFSKLYSEYPEFRPTQSLMKDHLLAINDTCKKLINNESLKPKDHKLNLTWSEDAQLSADYARLCQAETTPVAPRPLSCLMMDWGSPYWRFKMEVLHLDPGVYLTYDVINPAERQFIMKNMMDEENASLNGFVYEFWSSLPRNSSVSESLVRRTESISQAEVHNTRSQVLLSSIPVGAEYVIDQDINFKMENPEKYRFGCTMFFLEEPQAGGLMVFPRLGLSVAPVAGAALTQFNSIREGKLEEPQAGGLMVFPRLGLSVAPVAGAALTQFNSIREGKVDQRTVFGTCPTIRGHQTQLTLWFKKK